MPQNIIGPSGGFLPELKLLIDGDETFEAVLGLIRGARKTIVVQTFIWRNDNIGAQVAAAMLEAADRGVKIDISKDAAGTFFEIGDLLRGRPGMIFVNKKLKNHPNVNMRIDLLKDIDHSKYYIIDKRYTLFGGMNIADEYHKKWHDYMALVDSPEFSQAFENKTQSSAKWPMESRMFLAVNDRSTTEIHRAILEAIKSARKNIIFEHAYFSQTCVINALVEASHRGIEITVILPESPGTHLFANRMTINTLLANCSPKMLSIRLLPGMTHAKVGIIDDSLVIIGSANLTPRSMRRSREVALFAHGNVDDPFAASLRESLLADIEKSRAVTAPFEFTLAQRIAAITGKYTW